MPRALSPLADRLLRWVRKNGDLQVAGLAERAAVAELVRENLVTEAVADNSAGYSATISVR